MPPTAAAHVVGMSQSAGSLLCSKCPKCCASLQVGAPLLKAVRRALGLGKVSADTAPMPKARARTAAAPPLQEGEVAAQPQQHSAAVVTAALKRQVAASGDDYADDFEELVAQDDTETKPARVKKSKQTKGKRPKTVTM